MCQPTGEPASRARTEAAGAAGAAARAAKDRAEAAVAGAPLASAIGAAAVGLLAGALLPATRPETAMLGPLSRKVGDGARAAFSVARDAGEDTLITLGLNEVAARLRIDDLLDAAATALSAMVDAAADALPAPTDDDAPR